jgi:hypothetical protein
MSAETGSSHPHERGHFSWKLFGILLLLAMLGVAAVVPYSLSLQPGAAAQMPLGLVWILTLLQNAVLFSIAIAVGLWAGERVGVGSPRLRRLVDGDAEAWAAFRGSLPLSIGLGVAAGVLVLLVDVLVFLPLSPSSLQAGTAPPAWQGLLASFYGGISEELLMRLGLMTLLMWLFSRLTRRPGASPAIGWAANVGAALLFGAGHLPATAAITTLTGIVIIRALVLNGLVGVVCGWLYWKRGLYLAMIAHFSADIVLHVVPPLLAAGAQ